MRIRTLAASAVLAAALGIPLAGVALAQDDVAPARNDVAQARNDRNCADFASQADAQATYDADPSDPNRLDADDDELACENYDGYAPAARSGGDDGTGGTEQVSAKPVGGVEAGDGPLSGTGTDPLPIVAGALVAGGVGAVALRRVARRAS